MIETKEDHLNYLQWMKEELLLGEEKGGIGLCSPKCEGAFYFGLDECPRDYIKSYEKECKKRGWL